MRRYIKIVGIAIAFVGIAVGSGYVWCLGSLKYQKAFEESEKPIVVEVLEEIRYNSLSPVPEHVGILSYSNETVKLDLKYALKCRREDNDRIIGLCPIDSVNEDGTAARKEGLDAIVDVGSRLSFPKGNLKPMSFFGMHPDYNIYENETYFHDNTQVGNKRVDRITVL